jgi:hypothetical protein
MGMALTTAGISFLLLFRELYFTPFIEKLQAISGPWPGLVREITKEYYQGKDGLSANLDLDKTRARDFQNLSQTLFCIDQLPDHIQGTTMQLEKWLAKEDGPSAATRAKIHDVFQIYKDLAKDKQLKTPFKKPLRVAPAEFIMIGVLIAIHKETLSLCQLSQAIGILRTETRAVHEDVRTNAKVFKTMFNIIAKKVKAEALKDTPGKPTAGNSSKFGKRKRDESSEKDTSDGGGGEEEEWRPKPAKTRVPPHPAGRMRPPSANSAANAPSAPSRVKIEETRSVCALNFLLWSNTELICR